jgi:predicted CxxxxCH...CXXCH cytochrome family protein
MTWNKLGPFLAAAGILACGVAREIAEHGGGGGECTTCHGAPPPSHASTSTNCSACHPGTVKPDGTIDVASGLHANGHLEVGAAGGVGHPQGWSDPAQHGPAAKRDLGSCQGCHGISFDGGTAGVSCNACHGGAAWISNCTFCHGTKLATYAAGDLAKAAPPRGTAGETASTARAVGAHQRHLSGGSIGGAVACAECHAVPTDLSHLDGSAVVTFGAAAKRGGALPVWNGASCASTYCHGATLAGGTRKAPSWIGGAAETSSCGSCHGAPPTSGRHAKHVVDKGYACGQCHAGYTASTVVAATHVDGLKQVGGTSGWNATTRSCSNGCHGTKSW